MGEIVSEMVLEVEIDTTEDRLCVAMTDIDLHHRTLTIDEVLVMGLEGPVEGTISEGGVAEARRRLGVEIAVYHREVIADLAHRLGDAILVIDAQVRHTDRPTHRPMQQNQNDGKNTCQSDVRTCQNVLVVRSIVCRTMLSTISAH